MRQVLVLAPEAVAGAVTELLDRRAPLTADHWWADGEPGRAQVSLCHVENHEVEGLVEDLRRHAGVRVALQPTGALVMQPDDRRALERTVRDVTFRSPVEIVSGSLQSVGSWTGFLGYAATSALVSWAGLYTDTVFLLVAAMLIAPFAEPAMIAAIATARGAPSVLGRSLLRYGAAFVVTALVAAAMTLIFGMEGPTRTMSSVGSLSYAAVVLPLAAGVAGALNLAQSQRSSLVSGAAAGMLVAAALAPPAAVAGMAVVLGGWPLVASSCFVLALQLVGIHLAASVVFRLAGVDARERAYQGGVHGVWPVSLAVSVIVLVGLVALQPSVPTTLGRGALTNRAEREVQRLLSDRDDVRLLEVDARFPQYGGPDTLLVTGIITPRSGDVDSDALSRAVRDALAPVLDETVPLVSLQTVP